MIFQKKTDLEYHDWFAWRPVKLRGPDEWDRCKQLDCYPRTVWLCWVKRRRGRPDTYYALPDVE